MPISTVLPWPRDPPQNENCVDGYAIDDIDVGDIDDVGDVGDLGDVGDVFPLGDDEMLHGRERDGYPPMAGSCEAPFYLWKMRRDIYIFIYICMSARHETSRRKDFVVPLVIPRLALRP